MSLQTVSSPVVPPSLPTSDSCPRCKKLLIDPKGLGWCKSCGYCRSLEETEKKAVAVPEAAPPSQLAATGAVITAVPRWFLVMILGTGLIVGATFIGARYLTLKPFERALLATLQIAFGFGVMFVGQFIGVMRIAPEEASLSFKDAVFPFHLYGLVFKRLPKSSLTVYCRRLGYRGDRECGRVHRWARPLVHLHQEQSEKRHSRPQNQIDARRLASRERQRPERPSTAARTHSGRGRS